MIKFGCQLRLFLLVAVSFYPSIALAAVTQVQAISVDTQSVNIQMNGRVNPSDINIRRLSNPSRVVMELDNAQVAEDAIIPVYKDGIQRIELKGNHSPIHNSARVTLVVDDARAAQTVRAEPTADGLKLNFSNGGFLSWLHGNDTPTLSHAMQPQVVPVKGVVPGDANRSLVSGIDYSDGQVLIKSAQPLTIKNQFTLKAPNRLVLDIDHAVLSDKSLIGIRTFADSNITQVRLGQFDADTVRITIQAENPARLKVSQTRQGFMAIGSGANTGFNAEPPQPVVVEPGYLQNIYLDNQNGATQIRVHTSVPMKQKITRSGSTIIIDMDNIAAVSGSIRYNQADFPQVKRMWIEKHATGSRVSVALDNADSGMQTAMYSAKKILEVSVGNNLAMTPPITLQRVPSGLMRVVIDPGHGGKDMGANRAGINEKDLNLSVAQKLRQALEARGVRVNMTRSTDKFLPLPEITNINNSISPDVFVSVHTNSSTNPNVTGLETYFYTPQSIPLANRVHQQMVSRVNSPDRGVRQARFYVIHHTKIPAILCEIGYISNPNERYSLTTEDRQYATANAIADGVVSYLKTRLTASGSAPDEDAAPPAPPANEPLVIMPDSPEDLHSPLPVVPVLSPAIQ